MDADARFAELNLELPPAPKPVGVYKPIVIVGGLAYLSGHGPLRPDNSLITGKVGADLSLEQGKLAARQVGLALLATLKSQLGSLSRVSPPDSSVLDWIWNARSGEVLLQVQLARGGTKVVNARLQPAAPGSEVVVPRVMDQLQRAINPQSAPSA